MDFLLTQARVIGASSQTVTLMKRYGIRITLPEGSTLSAPHLLGPGWESFRWFETEEARERALAEMARELPNYRKGDRVAQVLERVERDS